MFEKIHLRRTKTGNNFPWGKLVVAFQLHATMKTVGEKERKRKRKEELIKLDKENIKIGYIRNRNIDR